MTFMGISPGKTAFRKLAFQKILYRGGFFVALLLGVALSAMANAQEEMPQITPGERKAPRKKDAGPRAVGVLQLAANGKASLVPIAILVDGKFWDATAYKADPIPMALEPGTVYEAERAGNSLGLFTVNSALHSNAVNVQSPWLGTGSWVPEGSEKPKTALTAEKAPIGIETTDEPPRLTRRESPPQPSAPTPAPASAPPNTAGGSASPGKTSSKTESNPSSPAPSSSPPAPAGNPKSGDAKPPDAKPPSGPSIAASDSGADEESRPRLRRGKPVAPFADEDIPGYSKPGTTATFRDRLQRRSCRRCRQSCRPTDSCDLRRQRAPAQVLRVRVAQGRRRGTTQADDGAGEGTGAVLYRSASQSKNSASAHVESRRLASRAALSPLRGVW